MTTAVNPVGTDRDIAGPFPRAQVLEQLLSERHSCRGFRPDPVPRPVIKSFLALAQKTGNPILPFTVSAQHYWTVNSWDRLQIPRPFTRAKLIFGNPNEVDSGADDAVLAAKLEELQSELERLTEQGNNWTAR